MSEAQISLMKTLCAMRWIALMKCDHKTANVIEQNITQAERAA